MHLLKSVLVIGLFVLCSMVIAPVAVFAAPAPDANSVLVLDITVSGGGGSLEATKAAGLGFTVVMATPADWAAMTAADFASYRALILGDATCAGIGTSPWLDAPTANRTVWSPVVNGNVVVIGTDPVFHQGQGGAQLVESGIAFAGDEPTKTGLYACLSCYYHGTAPGTPVPVLDQFGMFTAVGVCCYNDSHIVAVHPALAGTTDASLSNWSCSVHEALDGFPTSGANPFVPLAIAENIGGPGSLSFADGTFGIPYILVRGEAVSPIACGDGVIQPPEECDDGNVLNGDGCSATCKIENKPPVCEAASASPAILWPPNHKYRNVAVVGVVDPEGTPLTVAVTNVMQDEPVNGLGDGDMSPDAQLMTDGSVNLRAERAGTPKVPGDGRVYHLSFTATDAAGDMCAGKVSVCVPHDMGKGNICVDEGPLYDSPLP